MAAPRALGQLEPAEPSLIDMAFAFMGHRLRLACWLLVVAFSPTFLLYTVVMLYCTPGLREAGIPDSSDNTRILLTYFGAMVSSPIALWGPLLIGCGAYAVELRLWPHHRVERLSA